jgi:hypothetical protein
VTPYNSFLDSIHMHISLVFVTHNICYAHIVKTKYINVISNDNLSKEDKTKENTSNRDSHSNGFKNESENTNEHKRYEWTQVKNKRKKKEAETNKKDFENKNNFDSNNKNNLKFLSKPKQPVLIGKNKNTDIKGIPQRLHIYTSRWPKETTATMVADHVTSITNSVELIVEQIPLKFGEMKSFKVITPYSCYDMIYNVENWPDNVLVKRFGYSNKNNKSSVKNETSGIKKIL